MIEDRRWLKTWVGRWRDQIPVPAKVFSLEISIKVFHLIHPVLIDNLFHVRDTIFVQSSVVQCGNVPVFK